MINVHLLELQYKKIDQNWIISDVRNQKGRKKPTRTDKFLWAAQTDCRETACNGMQAVSLSFSNIFRNLEEPCTHF